MSLNIREIEAKETAALRQSILRPHQGLEEVIFPNDLIEGAFHLGAFEANQMVGIVSMYPESEDGDTSQKSIWRLRGMATSPEVRGKGYGKLLVERALEKAREKSGEQVWCNARTSACGFYLNYGFQKKGDEFDIPGIGPHYVMYFSLT